MKALFFNHVGFWLGTFGGGALGYLYGAWVKASVYREFEALKVWAENVRKGVIKI